MEGQGNKDKNNEEDTEHAPNSFLIPRFSQQDFLWPVTIQTEEHSLTPLKWGLAANQTVD